MSPIGILGFFLVVKLPWLPGKHREATVALHMISNATWSSSGCHENATREGLQDFTDFAFFGTSAYVDSGMTKSESYKKRCHFAWFHD